MRTTTIKCDCCGKELKPGEFYQLDMSIKSHGRAGKIPDRILLDDICKECTYEIHQKICVYVNTKNYEAHRGIK